MSPMLMTQRAICRARYVTRERTYMLQQEARERCESACYSMSGVRCAREDNDHTIIRHMLSRAMRHAMIF